MEYADVQSCSLFLKDESGATAIEYGLIAAGISVVIIFRGERCGNLNAAFGTICDQPQTVNGAAATWNYPASSNSLQ